MSESIKRLVHKAHKLPADELKERLLDAAEEICGMEAAFECLSTGLIIVDKDGVLHYANKAACRLLSIPCEDEESATKFPAQGREESVWNCVGNKEIAAFLRGAFESATSKGALLASQRSFQRRPRPAHSGTPNRSDEFSISSQSGTVHFIVLSIQSLVAGFDVSVPGYVITCEDITERRKSEIAAHRMESLAELTNLAASMAHEIKNPLGSISIHVQLVQKALSTARGKGGALPDEKFIEEPLRVVNEEVDALNNLVMQFLMAVRPINAQMEILDICPVIKDTIDFIAPEFEKYGFSATCEVPNEPVRLLIDGRLMKEAFINMAQNSLAALKECYASSDGGRFCIAAKADAGECVIIVADNALGMASEVASRIFEPYFTTKAQGTGLGMTMVYKIIKEFNGSIEVKSSQGEEHGTVFTIRLPLPQTGKVKGIEYAGQGKK